MNKELFSQTVASSIMAIITAFSTWLPATDKNWLFYL
jgi:hypothetical protein